MRDAQVALQKLRTGGSSRLGISAAIVGAK